MSGRPHPQAGAIPSCHRPPPTNRVGLVYFRAWVADDAHPTQRFVFSNPRSFFQVQKAPAAPFVGSCCGSASATTFVGSSQEAKGRLSGPTQVAFTQLVGRALQRGDIFILPPMSGGELLVVPVPHKAFRFPEVVILFFRTTKEGGATGKRAGSRHARSRAERIG